MIDLGAAAAGLTGAWRLARLDRGGMRYFDATEEGFWRSFQAALIAAPLYAALVLLRPEDQPLSSDPLRAVLVESIGYVIRWTAFPLAAWYLARAFDCGGRYFGFIVAYNWAQVLQLIIAVPVAVLAASSMAPSSAVNVVALAVTCAVLYYEYFIARSALVIDALPALAFVAADVVIGLILDYVEASLQMQ